MFIGSGVPCSSGVTPNTEAAAAAEREELKELGERERENAVVDDEQG
jgi:hypothetical protein